VAGVVFGRPNKQVGSEEQVARLREQIERANS
jgi:hypothetical protein